METFPINKIIFSFLHQATGQAWWLDWFILFAAVYLPVVILIGLLYQVITAPDRRTTFRSFLFAVGVGTIALFLVEIIKAWWPLDRPLLALPDLRSLFHPFDRGSFPSAHAAFWGGLTFTWWRQRRGGSWCFFLLALVMAIARVIAGVHWPFDVIAGLALGLGIYGLAWLGEKERAVLRAQRSSLFSFTTHHRELSFLLFLTYILMALSLVAAVRPNKSLPGQITYLPVKETMAQNLIEFSQFFSAGDRKQKQGDRLLINIDPPVLVECRHQFIDCTLGMLVSSLPLAIAPLRFYQVDVPSIVLSGSIESVNGIKEITWSNDRGAIGETAAGERWTIPALPLWSGRNIITVTVTDGRGVTSSDQVIIDYQSRGDRGDTPVNPEVPTTLLNQLNQLVRELIKMVAHPASS